jgi:cysteine desulfuration protein SufE
MSGYPPKLAELMDLVALLPDRADRIQVLIDLADRFRPVPEAIATAPYPDTVPACESEAYVFAHRRPEGTLKFHFAVLNPQGVSAKALAVILDETLSGLPPAQIAEVPREFVHQLFGGELSMGKSMGLLGMVSMVRQYARQAMTEPG